MFLACGALLSALLIAACGGGGNHDAEKAAFVKKANAICAQSRKEIGSEGFVLYRKAIQSGESRQDAEEHLVTTLLIPGLEREVKAIHSLQPPAGDEEQIANFLEATEEALEEAKKEPQTYMQAGGHYRFGSIHYERANKLATEYGITECPQG